MLQKVSTSIHWSQGARLVGVGLPNICLRSPLTVVLGARYICSKSSGGIDILLVVGSTGSTMSSCVGVLAILRERI